MGKAKPPNLQKVRVTIRGLGKPRTKIVGNKQTNTSKLTAYLGPQPSGSIPDQGDPVPVPPPQQVRPADESGDELDDIYIEDIPAVGDVESDEESEDEQQQGAQQQQGQGEQPHKDPVQQIKEAWAEQYMDYAFYNQLKQQQYVAAERHHLEVAANDIMCSTCGPTQQGVGSVEVYIGTKMALHRVRVHNRTCSCNVEPWLPSPIQFDCLAGNPAACSMKGVGAPLLFTRQLVADLDRTRHRLRAMSTHGYTQKLTADWEDSVRASNINPQQPALAVPCTLPFQEDTIRRRLQVALGVYRSLEHHLHQVVEQLQGWPLGPSRPCGACAPGDIHLHYDHTFGARLLQRPGYTLDYRQPPNQSIMMSNAAVTKGLAAADAAIKLGQPCQRSTATAAAPDPSASGSTTAVAAAAAAGGTMPPVALPAAAASDGASGVTTAAAAGAGGEGTASGTPAAADVGRGGSSSSSSNTPDAAPISCSDFRADRLAAKDSARYLIKAVGVVACRHGHIYLMLNAFEGERHAYAITALEYLVQQGVVPRVWWYDINCRWGGSLRRWLQQQPDDMKAALKDLLLPIPPWHLYAHKSECKVQHGHLHMEGTGRGSGEVCEIVNSALAPLGMTSKYMAPATREALFERIAFLRGRELDGRLSTLLLGMLVRAQRELLTATADIAEVKEVLQQALMRQADTPSESAGRAAEPAQRMAEAVQRAKEQLQGRSRVLAMGWQGDYVKAYLVVQRAETITGSSSTFHPPMSLLFPAAAVDGLKVTAASVRASKATMRSIEKQHFGSITPTISHPEVQRGVSQWVAAAVGQLKDRLETTIRHVQFLNSLVQPLGMARQQSQKKKVLKQKAALQQRAEVQLKELHAAARWALALKQGNVVAAWEGNLGPELSALVSKTCQQLKAELDSCAAGGAAEADQAGAAAARGADAAPPAQLTAAANDTSTASLGQPVGTAAGGSSSSSSSGPHGAVSGTAAVYTADEAALRLYLLQLRKSHLEEEVVLVQKERQQLLDNLHQRVVVLGEQLLLLSGVPLSGCNKYSTVYLLAQELQRSRALLNAAQQLHAAPEAGIQAALAAADAILQGELDFM